MLYILYTSVCMKKVGAVQIVHKCVHDTVQFSDN